MTSLKPKNILLIQLGDIGDVVLTFPCVRALKETYSDAKVVVIVRKKAAELIEMCQWADGVVSVDEGKKDFWGEIKYQLEFFFALWKHRFDLVVDMRTGTRGAILAFLSGATKRVSYYAEDGKLWRNRVFTDLYKPESIPGYHVLDFHLDLLSYFNIRTGNREPEIYVSDHLMETVEKLLKKIEVPIDKPILAIQPFSLWRYKEWSESKFINLIASLSEEFDLSCVITGGEADKNRAENMVKECRQKVFNLAGKTTLGLYAALLKKSTLLFSVDSVGPHIAAAVGTPTVTIYGPSSPSTWAPRGRGHQIVQKDLDCIPCYKMGCNNSLISRCIDELSVHEVNKVVTEALKKIVDFS